MSGKRYISNYEVKLISFGNIIHGKIEYYIPSVDRRLHYGVRRENELEGDPNGNVKFMARVLKLSEEDICSVDLKVYPAAKDEKGEVIKDQLKDWDSSGLECVEHIIDKDLLKYFDFGQEVTLDFMLHMSKGFVPGKKFRVT